MMKHIGKHADKKVVVLFRQVPGEDHMCLVVYPEVMPTPYHDGIMSILESAEGQQEKVFAEILNRRVFSNGENIFQSLHREGMIKKVQTGQIVMTPDAKNAVRLDELNELINKIDEGGEAAEKLQQLDSNAGMATNADTAAAMEAMDALSGAATVSDIPAVSNVLSNENIAKANLEQASNMENEAQGLLVEANRMKEEAYSLDPSLKPKRGRGRPVGSGKKATA